MSRVDNFDYRLRPCKQVERRLIGNVLAALSSYPLNLQSYQYFGMGSIHYADFLMIHNLFGLNRMTCIEGEPIPLRMGFNKPFSCIDVKIGQVSSFVGQLRGTGPSIAWLDYDYPVNDSLLQDVESLVTAQEPQSIGIVTVKIDLLSKRLDEEAKRWLALMEPFSLAANVSTMDLKLAWRLKSSARLLWSICELAAARRVDAKLEPLFCFEYADGATMLTIGYFLHGSKKKRLLKKMLKGVDGFTAKKPLKIAVPVLTSRERSFLDQHLPAGIPNPCPFEIDGEKLKAFASVYRFAPKYNEVLW